MAAWGEAQHADGKVRLLADTNADLAKGLGLAKDYPVLGGTRFRRFSALVDNGVLTVLNVEPEGAAEMSCSLSNELLKQIK